MLIWHPCMQIGANPAIAAHSGKFMGIRNGIDLDIWDPENDNLLPMPYTASNVAEVRLCCLLTFCEPTETLNRFLSCWDAQHSATQQLVFMKKRYTLLLRICTACCGASSV